MDVNFNLKICSAALFTAYKIYRFIHYRVKQIQLHQMENRKIRGAEKLKFRKIEASKTEHQVAYMRYVYSQFINESQRRSRASISSLSRES